ncbi:L-serine ammonia-lyase, iron-sulfur-dependent, subunit alpha [Holdemanella biformis]|jgi:L-serine dehydratase|uniref:L-serine ammonia-lyase, iron-sulfur-dependent, subunit alpha n=1 Tax=Holdemanella biformis TaxID=1735 RepID=UPI000ED594B2|nr:L-serine ammonia-lyase, iron-sulfur-dependent, subunit alpha [Holdemanella biformis]MBD8958291.1 L-serine ammonia-lyase [Holdemanella biformis]MBD9052163.1 L-serine ammonia-lyase [Holdemanella biformis]MBS6454355.1 L-serine ammonia-lyase, iron-sulfur-dependent, subunit alpha [Holdemanella biformis]HCR68527.1 L-serine ammonia-lyase [Erysipelotrichaceae bacterium]
MQSIKTIYKIGPGPSSSHTFGPMMASKYINEQYPDATHFKITLFGSLALTGKGHLTDKIILKTLGASKCEIIFDMKTAVEHPNTMIIEVFDNDTKVAQHTFVSIGGGKIEIDGKKGNVDPEIYPHTKMDDIQVYCNERHLRLDQYIDEVEDSDFDSYMNQIFKQMLKTVNTGLKKTGVLPGSLKIDRVAHALHQSAQSCSDIQDKNSLLLSSYAYAANEQNASGGIVVTAPTMGSCGVLPSLVYHFYHDQKYPKKTLIQGLKVAGLIGNLIQTNATISGAKAGCQAEVGAACSMGAAFVAYCQLQNNEQIECAAEIGLEHHLGLTCDPVGGYVMIPCIERNAVAAQRSVDAARLAKYLRNVKKNRVSFDMVVQTMNLTGKKLPIELKESALGGLAVVVPEKA